VASLLGFAFVGWKAPSVLTTTVLVGSSTAVCECGEDRTTEDQEEVEGIGQFMQPDKALHPWRYAGDREGLGLSY
jgi:hypothetical protein